MEVSPQAGQSWVPNTSQAVPKLQTHNLVCKAMHISDWPKRPNIVIPTKVGLSSYKIAHHDEARNEEGICVQLDLLVEVRVTAKMQMGCYQDLIAKLYNTKVKPRHFKVGDLVLRNVTIATKDSTQAKLGPNGEGPFWIVDCYRRGTYHVETLDE